MLEFGNRLKGLRKQKGLTQEQLAQRLWVTKSTISAYEPGTKYPSLDMLTKLAQTFNVSSDFLLGIEKECTLNISKLSNTQIEILNKIINEFK